MSLLVTGASGFIAKNFIQHCLKKNLKIFAISRKKNKLSNKNLKWIVGQFNDMEPEDNYEIVDELTIIADGSTIIRELNKKLEWNLPEEGAKTLNGLIIDHLNQIPTNNVCIEIDSFKLETFKIESNKVIKLKVSKTN